MNTALQNQMLHQLLILHNNGKFINPAKLTNIHEIIWNHELAIEYVGGQFGNVK